MHGPEAALAAVIGFSLTVMVLGGLLGAIVAAFVSRRVLGALLGCLLGGVGGFAGVFLAVCLLFMLPRAVTHSAMAWIALGLPITSLALLGGYIGGRRYRDVYRGRLTRGVARVRESIEQSLLRGPRR